MTAGDGTRLIARHAGRGVPVVLVHGSAGGLDSWNPVTPFLDDGFEVWVYARRGYAPSSGCGRPKTYADDVDDLRAVLTAIGRPAHVVGGSYGGTVALHAANANRTAIRSVTVFEPPLYAAGPPMAAARDRYRELLQAGDLATATRVFATDVARMPAAIVAAPAEADAGPPPDDADRAAALAEAVGCLHDLEAMAADTVDVQRWRHIDAPALILHGSDTWAPMPATMAALANALPGARRTVLPGQTHFAPHTAPGLFAQALRAFLDEHNQ